MAVFDAYAACYDLLNHGKDYAGEAAYVERLARRVAPHAASLLELGCGTGGHAEHLAARGWTVTGADLSPGMLDRARTRQAALAPEIGARIDFCQGDARSLRLARSFDVVASLFHVVCYQSTDADLEAVFRTAAAHLAPGGVFIFDVWYGPAVLTDRPTVRERRAEGDGTTVVRTTTPRMDPRRNLVDVDFHFRVETGTRVVEFDETHRMRYLFEPELERLAAGAGIILVDAFAWGEDRPPGLDTWNAGFVGRLA
ncbi:MAG: class I SAM-dependent DNA methyltransferase [Actinomycetota bacterium]